MGVSSVSCCASSVWCQYAPSGCDFCAGVPVCDDIGRSSGREASGLEWCRTENLWFGAGADAVLEGWEPEAVAARRVG